ncbi:MAG: DUF1848 domain-containing protein [Bacteroidales bacterium]|nr:DUF1848 domain-containing protein [Bacteroidales bacterium]
MHKWKKHIISTTENGFAEAIAPLILSVSRATDIPAFGGEWFLKSLDNGYFRWQNPFNGSVQYVSITALRAMVFWTKNPQPLIPILPQINKYCNQYYFLFTLNNYDIEGYEPFVPKIEARIKTFKQLSQLLGKEKIQWRFDPLLLSDQLSLNELKQRIYDLGTELCNYTNKLIFSFVEIEKYRKVKSNILRFQSTTREFTNEEKTEMLDFLEVCLAQWKSTNPEFEICSCAQEIDLSNRALKHSACIDYQLLQKLFPDDLLLQNFIYSCKIKKDKGQRPFCNCFYAKDIGVYNTCNHNCIYCYANSGTARKNMG